MEPLPEDISRFLFDNVESIDQLEILRVLGEDREKEWDSVALAREVQAETHAVKAHLTVMGGRGLLITTTRGPVVCCRYGAGTPELEQMVSRLLQLYKERPVTMIKMAYERARNPLRAFADAFRVRKED